MWTLLNTVYLQSRQADDGKSWRDFMCYNDKEKMLWSHFNQKLYDNELHSLQFIPVDMAFLAVDED